ncbi:acetyl-CoA synthetase-like protein [Trametes elegans]|nr:acetyl-CoA synthetase-like protein [Trametes elegans]
MHYKSRYPPLPPLKDENIHDFVFGSPEMQSPDDKTLFIDPLANTSWTKNEFRERVYDAATAFLTPVAEGGLGFAPAGEIVAIMSVNCLEYVTIVHALFRAAIPYALIPSSTAFELQHLLRTSEATRLFVHPSLLPQTIEVARAVGLSEDRIYSLEGRVEGRTDLASAIDGVRTRGVPRLPSRPVTKDALAYLVFSSGTSGLPKAVMISHGNVIATMLQTIVEDSFQEPNPAMANFTPLGISFLPMYHTLGLHIGCIRSVWRASPQIIIPKWNADIILDLIPRYRVSVLVLTPPAAIQLVNHKRIREVDVSSVVGVGCGAAYLPPKVAKALRELFTNIAPISEGYGMSELTVGVSRIPHPKMGGPKEGSVGLLAPGMEMKIVRDDGTLAGPNEPGELWATGPNVALGYWRNEKATKETFVDGWVHTGDRLRVDEDQYLFFVERTKDVLKVSGTQVSPTEIEDVILAHPDKLVSDVTVAGVSGGRTADEKVPRAWVILSDGGKQRGEVEVIKALHAWVQKNLSKYKWLRGGIEPVDEIPKNPTGKVLRRVLQDRHEQQKREDPRAKL